MDFRDRPIAITDLETTGLDCRRHEIIEIGLLLVRQKSLEIFDSWAMKVKPVHIETANAEALRINGWNAQEWKDATCLRDALEVYSKKTHGAIFLSQNITFDWLFLDQAFESTGVPDLLDYHRLDLPTMSWLFSRRRQDLTRLNLKELCRFFNIGEEPMPHRAIHGARRAYEVLKKIDEANR